MKIPNLAWKLVCAIAAQEGWFVAGSRAQQNCNPGNLRSLPYPHDDKPVMKMAGYLYCAKPEIGAAQCLCLVAICIAEGESLVQLINRWAPVSDGNNPGVYIANVARWIGLPVDETQPADRQAALVTPLYEYLEDIEDPRKAANG